MRYLLFFSALAALAADPSTVALVEAGHFKRALPIVEQRYKANPKDPETLWLLSLLKQEFHDLNASLDLAEKALAANPKEPRYHVRVAEAAGESAEKGNPLHQLSMGRRFKKEIDAALALDPNNVDALGPLMEYYLQAPSLMGGDKAQAHAIPARIMRTDPVEGYFAEVRLASFDKQPGRFEELYRKAVEARPASAEAHAALANYLAGGVKKFGEAEQHAREAIRIDADRVGGHSVLAATLVEQAKWRELDEALAAAEKAIPDNLGPYFSAASRCLVRGVELPRAERYLRKYLSQEPEPNMPSPAFAHLQLGRALNKQGRKSEAVAEFQTAVKLNPESPAKQELKNLK
jgi:tetratricopeptide (TPR) repeat protein